MSRIVGYISDTLKVSDMYRFVEILRRVILSNHKKSTPLSILIEEQIPVSTDKQIEVEYEVLGATFNKTLGRLTWQLDLKPSEERKLKFSYSVKHPVDWGIDLE